MSHPAPVPAEPVLQTYSQSWKVARLGNLASEIVERNSEGKLGRKDVQTVDNVRGLIASNRKLGSDFSRYKLVSRQEFAYNPMRLNVGSIAPWAQNRPALVSPDYVVFRCNPAVLLPEFLDYFRQSKGWAGQIARSGQGSVRIRYYFRHIAEFRIPLPLLPEQRTIAHVLRTILQAKEKTEAVIAAARELKKSLLQYLFTYGPVPGQEAETVPLKKTEVGFMPESWKLMKLGEISKILSGGTPSRKISEYWNGDIPWVKTGEINYNNIVRTEEHITEAGLQNSSARVIPAETLLMAMYGQGVTRGRVAILRINAAINQACAAIVLRGGIKARFLYYFCTYHYEKIRNTAHGAHQKNLSAAMLKSIPVPVPSLREQKGIIESLQRIDQKILAEDARNQALQQLFQTLLHDLMTAKIRVNHPAEEVVA